MPRPKRPQSPDLNMRWCSKCQDFVAIPEFYSDRSRADNLMLSCRAHKRPQYRATRTEAQVRGYTLRYKYKISAGNYDAMLRAQGSKCAICRCEASTFSKRMNIDHCHRTGAIRGLLCMDCNLLLGRARDSIGTLQSAITYLIASAEGKGLLTLNL